MKARDLDNLDGLLSWRLKKAVGGGRARDWRDVRRRAEGRAGAGQNKAPRWSKRRILIAAAVLLIAIGAAAGASTSIIPWLDEEPKLVPPPEYPICDADDIEAKMYLQRLSGMQSGSKPGLTGSITLVNTGKDECALEGDAKFSLVGKNADSVPWRVELFDEVESTFSPPIQQRPYQGGQTLIGRAYEPVEERSTISLWWENWCGPGAGTDGWDGKPSLRIEIPNGTTLELPVYRLPSCIDSAQPSLLKFSNARPAPPPPGPKLPLRAEIVGVEEGEPFHIQPGKTFHFTIGLTNTGSKAFSFDKCPTYFEMLRLGEGEAGGFAGAGSYVLNCDSAGAIEPGETAIFAMEITAFADAWGGEGELVWTLGPEQIGATTSVDPPTAKARYVIDVEPTEYSPADVYSVFSPEEPEARFPAKAEKAIRSIANRSSQAGPMIDGSRRILLEGLGKKNTAIYAFLTESGKACYLVDYGASCDGGRTQRLPFSWILSWQQGGPVAIAGLVRDGIVKLDILVDGKPTPATVGKNSFYVEISMPGGSKDLGNHRITGFVVTKEDGTREPVSTDEFGCMKGGCVLG